MNARRRMGVRLPATGSLLATEGRARSRSRSQAEATSRRRQVRRDVNGRPA